MQPLNAIDAVAPAFTRTHQTLFQPFRMGRSWKLATSSYLGWIGAMFVPWPLVYFVLPHIGPPGAESMRAILYGVGVVTSFLALLVLYLCGRMELVVFEMVVTRSKFIAPMWRRYSARVWPWIEAGKIKAVIDKTFPLADVAKAHAYLESGAHVGKVVLTV